VRSFGHDNYACLSLANGEIVEENDLGSIRRVTADTLPILSGISLKRIVINPGAMRTPHWHANCNELTYCVSGTSFVSVLDTYSKFSSFTVSAGEMFTSTPARCTTSRTSTRNPPSSFSRFAASDPKTSVWQRLSAR
jgi:uncharacterized RmlC-like cupin family protein